MTKYRLAPKSVCSMCHTEDTCMSHMFYTYCTHVVHILYTCCTHVVHIFVTQFTQAPPPQSLTCAAAACGALPPCTPANVSLITTICQLLYTCHYCTHVITLHMSLLYTCHPTLVPHVTCDTQHPRPFAPQAAGLVLVPASKIQGTAAVSSFAALSACSCVRTKDKRAR